MFRNRERNQEIEIECAGCDRKLLVAQCRYDGDPSVGIPYGWEVVDWDAEEGVGEVHCQYFFQGWVCNRVDEEGTVCNHVTRQDHVAELAGERWDRDAEGYEP